MHAAAVQSWQASEAPAVAHRYLRLLPCLTDFAFILPLFLLFGMLSGTHQLFSDGDTGWHLRTGDWILEHRAVPHTDLFSFSMPDKAWYAWEWGWDVAFAAVNKWTGLAGVAFLNVLLLSLVSVLVFRLIRRYSDNDLLAFAFTMLAVCGSIIHWLARPHLISWVFALVFCHLILSFERGNRAALLATPLLVVIWTNLHGGFFLGIFLLVASALGEAAQVTFGADKPTLSSYRRSFEYVGYSLVCTAATLLNPYGWQLHQHVARYLSNSSLLDSITEFQSISFHQPGSIFFESMLMIGVAAAFWCFVQRRVAMGITVLFWAHEALFAGRNIPLFMLLSAAPAALLTQDLLNKLRDCAAIDRLTGSIQEIVQELKPLERVGRSYLLSGAALLFVGLNLAAGTPGFRPEFNPTDFPAATLQLAHNAGVNHLFTIDQWADYLIYRYYPNQRVFMDGRTDLYGTGLVNKYQRIMTAQYDCEALLNKFSIDGVLVKPDTPLATVLKHSPGWQVLFDNGSAILFRRSLAPNG